MRTISAALLLTALTAGCSQELAPSAGSAPAAAGGATAARGPAIVPAPSAPSVPAMTTPRAEPRAAAVHVTVPTLARGAIVAADVRGSANDDVALAVATDGSSTVTAGRLGGAADIGCGMHATPNGAAYVTMTAADGTCSWVVYFDGSGFVSPGAVTVAPDGSVYVAGSFEGTATFDEPRTSGGGLDGFVAKIFAGGALAWARTFGGADDDYAYAVAATSTAVTVGGAYYGAATFGDTGSPTSTSNGDADAFLVTYAASDATMTASRSFGGPGWDAVNALTIDAAAHVVAAGTHAGDVDLGTGNVVSAGGQDGFLAVYDGALAPVAARSFGGAGDDAAHGVVTDASNRVVVAGYFMTAADVGAPAPLTGSGRYTAFWAAYDATDPSLAFDTAATLDSDGGIIAEAIGIGPTGDIVIAGQFTGATAPGPLQMSAGGGRAGYAASFSPLGALAWATPVRGTADTEILAVARTASGVVAVGSSNGTLECSTAPNAGGSDVVVLVLGN